jgi:hypothetical protein
MDQEIIIKKSLRIGSYIFVGLFLLLIHSLVSGQPVIQEKSSSDYPIPMEDQTTSIDALEVIVRSIQTLQDQLKDKEEAIPEAKTEEQKNKILSDIREINERIESLEKNFEIIATGVDLKPFAQGPKERFDWQEEIQELLGPIIKEIKKATAHPREIEKLRGDIAYYREQIPILQEGIQNIQKQMEETENQRLKEYLSDLKKTWMNKNRHISNQLAVAQYQLNEKLKVQKSFFETFQGILRIFFKNRGRNLILALSAFIFTWLLFHFLHAFIYKVIPFKKGKIRTLYTRLITLIYYILTFVGSTGAMLFVLYISGDWVLLGLAIIFLFGLAWAARQALPRFWEQVKFLLNLGPVKENERLIYNGLPWKVQSLSLYTPLINPELKGGMIRLPFRDLLGLHSRPYHPDEPWFPCREGEWVILADETYGKVVNQTPEIVELLLLGDSHKIYPTPEFLKQNPNNISKNFRLNVTFGIDYQHQMISTCEIPDQLQKILIKELSDEGFENDIIHIKVEFKEAGASSLDMEVLADFSGRVAKDYAYLSRAIQRICVEASNQYGWIIPFTQLTVHTANSSIKEK